MIIVVSTRSSAADIADALGDQRKESQLVWVSNSVDIRAVRQAIALSGGRAFALSEFQFGFLSGAVLSLLLVTLFQQAVSVGGEMYRLQAGTAVEAIERR